jgi:hypothetical protein
MVLVSPPNFIRVSPPRGRGQDQTSIAVHTLPCLWEHPKHLKRRGDLLNNDGYDVPLNGSRGGLNPGDGVIFRKGSRKKKFKSIPRNFD